MSSLYARRVEDALQRQFPRWVAANEAISSAEADKKNQYAEFLFAANWILRPGGLRELLDKLQMYLKTTEVCYDLESGSVKLRCLVTEQAAVMIACQLVADEIIQNEQAKDSSAPSAKIFLRKNWLAASQQEKGASIMAFAPVEILGFKYHSPWTAPSDSVKKGVTALTLVPGGAMKKLQDITGCTMIASYDGLILYIGAESQEQINVAQGKLNTLAKYAAQSRRPDRKCESFIYAEDKQGAQATFTYIGHGPKSLLKTFFLDRSKYRFKPPSTYGKIFEQGVVITLLDRNALLPVAGTTPAIPPERKDELYRAFMPPWQYGSKYTNYSSLLIAPQPTRLGAPQPARSMALRPANHETRVSSWVRELPTPASSIPPRDNESDTTGLGTNADNGQRTGRYDPRHPREQNVTRTDWTPPHLRGMNSAARPPTVQKQNLPGLMTNMTGGASEGWQQGIGAPQAAASRANKEPDLLEFGNHEAKPMSPNIRLADPFIGAWGGGAHSRGNQPKTMGQSQIRHSTMHQQAGAPKNRRKGYFHQETIPNETPVNEDPDPKLVQSISQKLARMMSCLELFQGKVTLKASLGRLCLTTINSDHVYVPGQASQGKAKSLRDIKDALDKHHINPQDTIFTNILTAEGGDANHIALMQDGFGERLWLSASRHTTYELACIVVTEDREQLTFFVEVDGNDFTYQLNEVTSNSSCSMSVHCPKRPWDFQVTLSKSRDLKEVCGDFAKDLVDNMRITPKEPHEPGIPNLEVILKNEYEARILWVRTRNTASYVGNPNARSSSEGLKTNTSFPYCVMEISEVHDMKRLSTQSSENSELYLYTQFAGNQKLGQLPTWYEVSLQSKMIIDALQQNQDLEFGDEVDWSPEALQQAGAFDELIRSTFDMVKKIDGVGYWGDNFQDAYIHGIPASQKGTGFGERSMKSIW
ncbi:uncharacterized protein F4822DRAFT_445008 [Hypoxylon trugodes]|uniref:uncharacterized protein n=1 Tax=Hypoxylon trugodes TaxID=326681 RepID=UPI002196AE67|nr:uncharacterized protein F4822DRAFT_445008 [Hypoxylon trugodes]KAI1386735.1 hypothetical protein F4822DRAFT_445008 [Hypoxylon trugodes]